MSQDRDRAMAVVGSGLGEIGGSKRTDLRIAILGTQPIDPPTDIRRRRLLGLYHSLGDGIQTRYIGSYHQPNEQLRDHHLTPTLEEIDVPLSAAHHLAAAQLAQQAGEVVIDVAFPRQGHLSVEYLSVAREAVRWADVVVFSQPWVFPHLAENLPTEQLVVYDSHSVEGFLHAQRLDQARAVRADLLREAVQAEYSLGLRANLILTCSQDDLDLFARVYEWPADKMRVFPNGVMACHVTPAGPEERITAKRALDLSPDRAAIFIGRDHIPDVQAASLIVCELAQRVPACDFVIAGDVGRCLPVNKPTNVRVTGPIVEDRKLAWLHASDLALNPVFFESGTNLQILDFLSAGLPVVTTQVGARGFDTNGLKPVVVVDADLDSLVKGLHGLVSDRDELQKRSLDARACVEEHYSWERISPQLGSWLREWRESRAHLVAAPSVSDPDLTHLSPYARQIYTGLKTAIGLLRRKKA